MWWVWTLPPRVPSPRSPKSQVCGYNNLTWDLGFFLPANHAKDANKRRSHSRYSRDSRAKNLLRVVLCGFAVPDLPRSGTGTTNAHEDTRTIRGSAAMMSGEPMAHRRTLQTCARLRLARGGIASGIFLMLYGRAKPFRSSWRRSRRARVSPLAQARACAPWYPRHRVSRSPRRHNLVDLSVHTGIQFLNLKLFRGSFARELL